MEKNKLRQDFGNETGQKIRQEAYITFNQDYVNWLEDKLIKALTIPVVTGSIGEDKKDKFVVKKITAQESQNPCNLCKYKGDGSVTKECDWCLDNNDYNQYYL